MASVRAAGQSCVADRIVSSTLRQRRNILLGELRFAIVCIASIGIFRDYAGEITLLRPGMEGLKSSVLMRLDRSGMSNKQKIFKLRRDLLFPVKLGKAGGL